MWVHAVTLPRMLEGSPTEKYFRRPWIALLVLSGVILKGLDFLKDGM